MKDKKIAPTPRTDERIQTIRIENEDSCCAIYVKIGDKDYDGALIDADFARQLELELAHSLANQVKAQDEVEHIKALLKDIPAVHTNTLRGNIATLSWDSYEHIIGPHPCRERAEKAEAEVERLKGLLSDLLILTEKNYWNSNNYKMIKEAHHANK